MRHNFINSAILQYAKLQKNPERRYKSGIFMASCGYIRADIIYSAP